MWTKKVLSHFPLTRCQPAEGFFFFCFMKIRHASHFSPVFSLSLWESCVYPSSYVGWDDVMIWIGKGQFHFLGDDSDWIISRAALGESIYRKLEMPKISIRKEWNGKGLGRQRSWKSLFPIFLCRALEEKNKDSFSVHGGWSMRISKRISFPSPQEKKQHFTLLISSSGWIVRIPEDMMKIFKTTNLGSIIGARRKTKKKKILTGVQQIFLLPYSFCRRSIPSYVWTNLLLPAPHRKRDRKNKKK